MIKKELSLREPTLKKIMPLLQSLETRACKLGIKSMARAINCCKEIKNTAPPNEWCNILFLKQRLQNVSEKCF